LFYEDPIVYDTIRFCLPQVKAVRAARAEAEMEARAEAAITMVEAVRVNPALVSMFLVYLSYHTTHTTRAERRAEKQRQRRSASSGCWIPKGASREKTRPPPVSRGSSP